MSRLREIPNPSRTLCVGVSKPLSDWNIEIVIQQGVNPFVDRVNELKKAGFKPLWETFQHYLTPDLEHPDIPGGMANFVMVMVK